MCSITLLRIIQASGPKMRLVAFKTENLHELSSVVLLRFETNQFLHTVLSYPSNYRNFNCEIGVAIIS